MAYRTPYPAVYPNLSKTPPRDIHRVGVDVLRKDTQIIGSVAPAMGVLSLIVQSAIRETAQYILENKLTYEQSEQLIQWICQRSASRATEKAGTPDDRRREESVLRGAEDAGKESAKSGEGTEKVSGGKGGGRGRGKRDRVNENPEAIG
jgi:hypothetical protein